MSGTKTETNRLGEAFIKRSEKRKTEDLNPYGLTEEDIIESDLGEDQKLVAIRNLKQLDGLTAIILWGGGPARNAAKPFCSKVDMIPYVTASSWILTTKEVPWFDFIAAEMSKPGEKVAVMVVTKETFEADSFALKNEVHLARNKKIPILLVVPDGTPKDEVRAAIKEGQGLGLLVVDLEAQSEEEVLGDLRRMVRNIVE